MQMNFNLNTVVLFSLGIFLIIIFCVFREETQKVVVFDFKGIYTTFLTEAAHRKLSQDEITQLGKRFPQAVSNVVTEYAKSHNTVILTKNAVVAGGKNITPEIQKLIAREMQHLAREGKK